MGYNHCRDSLGVPRAQGTSPQGMAAARISTTPLQVPASLPRHWSSLLSWQPYPVSSISDRRGSTLQALGLGNQRNPVTKGSLAFPGLSLCLGLLVVKWVDGGTPAPGCDRWTYEAGSLARGKCSERLGSHCHNPGGPESSIPRVCAHL